MVTLNRPSVTFLAFAHDPASQTQKRAELCSLASALVKQGWQVDWFTCNHHPDQPSSTWIEPYCRLFRLPVDLSQSPDPQIPHLAPQIQALQIKHGLLNPLFHSFDDWSAQVGDYFKQHHGWRWVHTPLPQDGAFSHIPGADQLLLWQDSGQPTDISLDELSRMRRRHQFGWEAIATRLGNFYRQHLAAHIGAVDLHIPKVHYLPLPQEHSEDVQTTSVQVPQYSYSA
jgi:hypothetical protein